MAEAVALAKLHPAAEVDLALGTAAIAGWFAENDLISILTYQAGRDAGEPSRAGEGHSLQRGTSAWSNFGIGEPTTMPAPPDTEPAISRGVTPVGVGTSASRSSSWARAVCPASAAARSSSVSGMLASIRWRLSLASSSCALLAFPCTSERTSTSSDAASCSAPDPARPDHELS